MRFDRVAITGGSGRLGTFVVDELRAHCEIVVLDRVAPERDVAFTKVDILDRRSLDRALAGCDAVVHLAGIDLDTQTEADAYLTTNVVGTWNLLEAAHVNAVRRVVLCSSVTATGLGEARPDFVPRYLPVDEDHPLAPHHPYGVSKRLMEVASESFSGRNGIDVVCLRPMLVMLPHNFALARERAADTRCRWLFYYVAAHDCARAFRCALDAPRLAHKLYFITAADTCHPEPTLAWAERALGRLPEVRRPELYTAKPRASIFDGSRAETELGFTPSTNWLDLEKTAHPSESTA